MLDKEIKKWVDGNLVAIINNLEELKTIDIDNYNLLSMLLSAGIIKKVSFNKNIPNQLSNYNLYLDKNLGDVITYANIKYILIYKNDDGNIVEALHFKVLT